MKISIFSIAAIAFFVLFSPNPLYADLSQTEATATTTLGGSKLVDLGTGLSGTVEGLSLMFADVTCTAGFCDNPVPFRVMPYNPDTLQISSNNHEWLNLYRSSTGFWHPSNIRARLGEFLFAGWEAETGNPAQYELDPRKSYVAGVRAGSTIVFGPSLYGTNEHSGSEQFATENALSIEHNTNEPVPAFILHGDIERLTEDEIPPEEGFEVELGAGEEIIYQRLPSEATGSVGGVVGIAFNENDPRGEAMITRVIVPTSRNRNLWAIEGFENGVPVRRSELTELKDGFTEFKIIEPLRLKDSVKFLLRGKRYSLLLTRYSSGGFSLRNISLPIADSTDGSVEVETGQANASKRVGEDPVMTLVGFYEPDVAECCSSVAFLPGLQASRLYLDEGGIGINRLWEPNTDSDGRKLFMTESGESINAVFTANVIDEGLGVVNVYKSFIEEMSRMVSVGDIADWSILPYDWRKNVYDVVGEDVQLGSSGTYNMVEAIEALAEDSQTGKVTLIAHSNGGLVGKILIDELEAQGKGDLVDKLVLVAVPQIGTPKAIASLLHGDYQEKLFGLILTAETARELGENMPGAYGLLPSEEYFEKVSDPVVVFDDDSSATAVLRARYGEEITDADALDRFMLGEDDLREDPDRDDLLSPIPANESLLSRARSDQAVLDNWAPPENIEVTQIVGWGVDTLKGVRYEDKEIVSCATSFPFCTKEIVMDHVALLTKDGDETVVSISADVADNRSNTYYSNLEEVNRGLGINQGHAEILEVDSVLELLNSIVKEGDDSLPESITTTKPSTSSVGDSLRLSVHSPVSIGVKDSRGNFTGLISDSDLVEISEEIPNSFYMPFGDGKYVGVPVGESYDVEIDGEGTGTFTLNIEKVSGDDATETDSFINIPVTADMHASLSISPSGEFSTLSLDVNGDGTDDVSLSPGEEFSSTDYVAVLRAMVENSNINKGIQNSLLVRLGNVEKNLEKNSGNSVDALLNSMVQSLESQQADDIVQIINILKIVLSE